MTWVPPRQSKLTGLFPNGVRDGEGIVRRQVPQMGKALLGGVAPHQAHIARLSRLSWNGRWSSRWESSPQAPSKHPGQSAANASWFHPLLLTNLDSRFTVAAVFLLLMMFLMVSVFLMVAIIAVTPITPKNTARATEQANHA